MTAPLIMAWLDPYANAQSGAPAVVVGPAGSGGGGGGGSIGVPVVRTATTGGAQAFAFAGSSALVFVNGKLVTPALVTIAAGTLTISATEGIVNGDQIVAYPI